MTDPLNQLTENYHQILSGVGEDPDREGLRDTPKRAAKAMQFLTRGYSQSLDDLVLGEGATFGGHIDNLGLGDFACLDFDCFNSIEFFKRRTDAFFTAVSSDASEVGDERGRARLLLCAKQGGVCA